MSNSNRDKTSTNSIITPINSLALKAVGCLIIVTHHYTLHQGDVHNNVFNEFSTLACGYIAVALFFFISGYGVMESEKRNRLPFTRFLRRRLSRVYIPFVITNILFIITLLFLGSYPFSIGNLLVHIFGIELIDSVTWFVPVTLLFYFFVLVLSSLQKRQLKACCMGALCIVYIILGISLFDIPFYAYVSSPAFPLGYISSLYSHEICQGLNGIFRWILLFMSAIIFALLSWAIMGHIPMHGHLLHGVIALNNIALLGIIVTVFAGRHYAWFHCKWLGDISYEVYLCHAKVFMVFIATTGSFATFHPLLLLIIIPIAYVISKLDKAASTLLTANK